MVAHRPPVFDYEKLASLHELPVSDVRKLHAAFDAGDIDRNGVLDIQEIHSVLECAFGYHAWLAN
jgi:Ca2+-binding EF-hand superfamily protein